MSESREEGRISRIETMWSMVQAAQQEGTEESRRATQQMIDRYGPAIRKYLLGATRNEDLAEELYQEFALRFLSGKYDSADASRGRFRSFLKTILFRLVAEHHRTKSRDRSVPMGSQIGDPEDDSPEEVGATDEFNKVWSEELLKKAWQSLARLEDRTGKPVFTIMQMKVAHPEMRSAELAESVSTKIGKDISVANARVILHRAREQFADLLIDEVQQTLETDDIDRVAEELQDLNLYVYCRPAVERRR